MIHEQDELAEAVVFFSDAGEVVREMTHSEFQAVLDNYVPALDFANRLVKAVYVLINSELKVRTAVFFKVQFNRKGEVESSWSLPLNQLARVAPKGPSLGDGPIGLICASQCPAKHYIDALWDPDLRNGKGELTVLKKALSKNKLGLRFREDDPEVKRKELADREAQKALEERLSARLRKEYAQEFRDHMAQLLKEQRLRSVTIANESKQTMRDLKREYNARLEDLRALLTVKDRQLNEERERNAALKDTIDGQAEKIAGLREYFELKLEKAQEDDGGQLRALKQNYQLEVDAKVEAAVTELKQMLQMREVELLYRNEQEANLHDEITRLRSDNQELIANSGDQLLTKLVERGISFVTFQPGAGHVTVPLSEMPRYLENPTAYIADYCGVSQEHYNAWLEHYHVPVCRAMGADGNECGDNINRVESPSDFHVGETDRCFKHRGTKSPQLKLA